MSYFFGTIASNGARIKEGKEEEVKKLIDKYNFETESKTSSGINCQLIGGIIDIWGQEWHALEVQPKNEEENDGQVNYLEEFLEALSPFLAQDLVIHSVGHEGCIFPFAAVETKVTLRVVV